jgi:two-component sensor histidine kinase
MPVQRASEFMSMRSENLLVGASEGATLVRESNHRIANNLMTIATLLRYQCRQLTKVGRSFSADEVREIFDDAGRRIELVGRLHRRMAEPIAPDTLNLSPYLNDVAETAIDILSRPGEVELEPISGDVCPVRAEHALMIGLIVGELVSSAVKFARPADIRSKLTLTCRSGEGVTAIDLANDGVGAVGAFDPDRDGGLGLGVAKLLVSQLKATLTFRSDAPGFVARLVVPTGYDLADVDAAGDA